MANDGKVVIELVGKDSATQTFVKSMQDMAGSVKKLEDSGSGLGKLSSVFASIQGHWASLASAIGGGISFAKFWSEFNKWAEVESSLLKMSKRLNDTVENVSALGYVAKKSGMDAEAFNIALERMQRNVSNAAKGVSEASGLVDEFGEPVGKASKTLDELGLRAEVLNRLPLPQKLKEISSAMKDNIAPADQSRIALELFGKSGGGLVLALKEGPQAIQKWIDRYAELGGVLNTEGAEALSKAKSATGDLTIAWNNFGRELYEGVAPAIAFIINRLTDLVLAAKNAQPAMAIAAETAQQYAIDALERGPEQTSNKMLTARSSQGGAYTIPPGTREAALLADLRKTPTTAPPTKSGGGGRGGGGGSGIDQAAAALQSFIDTMVQETARGAGDTEAILNAWLSKQSATLDKLAAKNLDVTAGKEALDAAYFSKLQKLNSDFTDWYNTELGNQQEKLAAEERKKLATVEGNEAKTAQVKEVYARKYADLSREMETERLNLFKGYLDTMAGLTPVLADQLGYKRQALDYELKLAAAALERSRREGKITQDTYDQAQAMQAVAAQAKKYSLEMENNKGLQGWAYGRVKADSQKNTWADAMEGLESFVSDAWTQGIQGAVSKTKVDYMEVAKSMAVSFLLNLGKQGIHKAFGGLAELISGGGPGKIGTKTNPMWVEFDGMGLSGFKKGVDGGADFERSAQKAGKVGYSMRGGDHDWDDEAKSLKAYEKLLDKMYKGQSKDMGGIQRLQERFYRDDLKDLNAYGQMQQELIDQNQELFKSEYLTDYENSFTGMTTNMTNVWGVAQGLMTAAGVSGEAQRYGAMVTYGMQGIALITKLAQGKVLADAAQAAASGYASVMEVLPWPINVPVAAAWAAIAFAGTMAAGAIKSSAGGDWRVNADGLRMVHLNETILPAGPAQGLRDLVENGKASGGGGLRIGKIHIDARGADKNIDWRHVVDRQIIPELDRHLSRRGYQKIGGGR
jgi:hypothetical protein